MKIKIYLLLSLFLTTSFLIAENQIAIASDGTKVILHDDGTWSISEINIDPDNFDFRKTRWNMSMEDVKASETLTWEEGETVDAKFIYTEIDFLGEKSLLVYFFNKDRLYQAKYVIIQEHSNRTDYWFAYKRFVKALKGKYGATAPDNTGNPIWKDDLYKNKPSDWGMAIATGDMLAIATWDTPNSLISTIVKGDNYKINLAVYFEAKDFQMIEADKVDAF